MSATTRLRLGLVCCILFLGTRPCSAAGPVKPAGPTNDGHRPQGGKKGKAKVKMIDALANRNAQPKLVDKGGDKLPLFPATYDWNEQKRVLAALAKVSKERTPEMWEALVRSIGDKRYCLTLKDMNEFYAEGNLTVGYFCSRVAYYWLVGVCNRHLPRTPTMPSHPLYLDIGLTGGLAKWRQQRAGKELYELQIEVCEETIRQLAKVAKVPERAKNRARRRIEEDIATLKRTKRPIFTNYSTGHHPPYTAKDAERIRRGVPLP
jgi:hypothetical protein